jgi:hypothetical protein
MKKRLYRHIYSELRYPTLKHLPQIILTTSLIEAWHGVFHMHYPNGLTPHLILDLAQNDLFTCCRSCTLEHRNIEQTYLISECGVCTSCYHPNIIPAGTKSNGYHICYCHGNGKLETIDISNWHGDRYGSRASIKNLLTGKSGGALWIKSPSTFEAFPGTSKRTTGNITKSGQIMQTGVLFYRKLFSRKTVL